MKIVASSASRKERLFHVAKRDGMPLWQSLLIRVIAILLAFLFCGVLTYLLTDHLPSELYESMYEGSFGTERRRWKLLKDIAVLLCISLAVTPAFRMRFWNTGAEGQVLAGCLATTACMYYFGGYIIEPVLILIMFVAAIAAGALWGAIPAVFKAKWNTNETLFTLMMNYIAIHLVSFFLLEWTPDGSSTLARLEYGHLPTIFNQQYLLIILSVVLLAILMYVYLFYTKHGYEISVVGESEKTARYIGINVPKVIIRTMIVSGAVCGLAGFLIVGGLDHSINSASAGGQGFTAIMVSWLAKFNPILMFLTSFLIIFLDQGAAQVSQDFAMSNDFPSVITAIILFFIIGCEFFINYRIVFLRKYRSKTEA